MIRDGSAEGTARIGAFIGSKTLVRVKINRGVTVIIDVGDLLWPRFI